MADFIFKQLWQRFYSTTRLFSANLENSEGIEEIREYVDFEVLLFLFLLILTFEKVVYLWNE